MSSQNLYINLLIAFHPGIRMPPPPPPPGMNGPPISLRIFYRSVSAARGLPHCSCVAHVRDTSYENYASGPSINRTDKRCPHIKSINLLIAFHPRTCAIQQQCGKSSVADTDEYSQQNRAVHSSLGPGGSIHSPGYLDRGVQILGGSNLVSNPAPNLRVTTIAQPRLRNSSDALVYRVWVRD